MDYQKEGVHIFTGRLESDFSYDLHICIDRDNIEIHLLYILNDEDMPYLNKSKILEYANKEIQNISHIIGAKMRSILPIR